MGPKHFSGFTFNRNAQRQTFEIRRCISTGTVEELYDKNTFQKNQIHIESTLPKRVVTLVSK